MIGQDVLLEVPSNHLKSIKCSAANILQLNSFSELDAALFQFFVYAGFF